MSYTWTVSLSIISCHWTKQSSLSSWWLQAAEPRCPWLRQHDGLRIQSLAVINYSTFPNQQLYQIVPLPCDVPNASTIRAVSKQPFLNPKNRSLLPVSEKISNLNLRQLPHRHHLYSPLLRQCFPKYMQRLGKSSSHVVPLQHLSIIAEAVHPASYITPESILNQASTFHYGTCLLCYLWVL